MTVAVPSEKSKRNTLLLLAGVFFLPFVIGTGLFWVDWRKIQQPWRAASAGTSVAGYRSQSCRRTTITDFGYSRQVVARAAGHGNVRPQL